MNLRHGWVWDTDHFSVNQFAHPYGGNLFFNSARSNGYNFWAAAPFSLGGSALWECFGETTLPSINDLANTTLGGIILGETTYRFSCIILDNRSTGTERVLREIGAALVDPIRSFNRLLRGEIGQVGENPPDRMPSNVRASVEVGYQRVDQGPKNAPVYGPNQAFTIFTLHYGDPLSGDVAHPFGAFRLRVALATSGVGLLSEARAIGFLAVHDFIKEERRNEQLAVAMHYHYYNNLAFENGGQGFSGGLISRFPIGENNSLHIESWLTGFVIAAVKSDYPPDAAALANETARNYDFGPGGGGGMTARFDYGDRWFVELGYEPFWIVVTSGVGKDQFFQIVTSRWQIRVFGHISVGERNFVYLRTGHYAGHPTTHTRDVQTRLYLAWTL
jgi:hypothetical protein